MATAMAVAGVMDGVFGGGEEATTAGEGASTVGEGASTAGEGASSSATTPSPTTATSAGGASQAASDGTRSILEMSTLEKFQHHLPRTALNMGTATSCHMAVEGKAPSAKGLVQNAVQALAQSMAHTCANEVGGWYGNNRVDVVSHKLLHAALGAGLGAAVSKNRTEGAIVGAGSAMAAELIAEMMGPSTADLDRKAQAGVVTQADWDAYFEEARYSANTARILVTTLTAFMGKDAEVAFITADNALTNNYEMHAVIQKAQTGSEEEFVEWFLEDWESEHGALTPDEQERLIRQLQRTYYSIKVNGFHHDLLNPGMKRFEEMAALSFDEFREQWLANEDPAKLTTREARRAAERIIKNQYDFYRMKSIDLAVGSVIGLVAGVRGSLSSPARQSMTAASPGSIRGAPKGVVVAQDVKALKLKSSAGFDARFKKSVRFNLDGEIVKPGNVVDASSFSPGSHIAPLERKGRVMFDGVEFRAVRDLGHMSEVELRAMHRKGINPLDNKKQRLDGHHHLQQYHREKDAFIVEIPEPAHSLGNKTQHPKGNRGGLTKEERLDWNRLRMQFNKERAKQELMKRGLWNE